MQAYLDDTFLVVYKALASSTRLKILNLLADNPSTITEMTKSLNLSKAIISRHIMLLEKANLIRLVKEQPSSDQRKKLFALRVDKVHVNFPKKIYFPYKKKDTEINIGYFTNFMAQPTCGLASEKEVIGKMDDPRVFVSNERIHASLLWLSHGYVEYKIPNPLESNQRAEMIEMSLEIASEFPNSNNIWPSDITFSFNDIEVGTWTSPGNYADVRGKLTPEWWESSLSQYGLLKNLRITHSGTAMDGEAISEVSIPQLYLNNSPFINIRIGVKADAKNKGGLAIFGKHFGNHPQDILVSVYYTENEPL